MGCSGNARRDVMSSKYLRKPEQKCMCLDSEEAIGRHQQYNL